MAKIKLKSKLNKNAKSDWEIVDDILIAQDGSTITPKENVFTNDFGEPTLYLKPKHGVPYATETPDDINENIPNSVPDIPKSTWNYLRENSQSNREWQDVITEKYLFPYRPSELPKNSIFRKNRTAPIDDALSVIGNKYGNVQLTPSGGYSGNILTDKDYAKLVRRGYNLSAGIANDEKIETEKSIFWKNIADNIGKYGNTFDSLLRKHGGIINSNWEIMEKGGSISQQGYRDDSPYRNRESIDIHSPNGLIDMSETGMPILANGRYLPPYSGMHQFEPGVVREERIMQNGGGTLTKNFILKNNTPDKKHSPSYRDASNMVNDFEHNINKNYREQAIEFKDKYYPLIPDENGFKIGGHNDYIDALRHAGTAMYTTSGQGRLLAPLKIPYTNVMGAAHELKGLGEYVKNNNKLTWEGAKQQLKETGSDLYNNFVGSMIGGLPVDIETKESILRKAKDNNILSDLSKKQNGGFFPIMKDGGQYLTVDGEYHRVYRNAQGDIIVNHPKEDKGKWDTINLTDKSDANTIAEGVSSVKKWHKENPYAFGGNVILEKYKGGGELIKRADGSYSKRGLWDNIRENAGSGKKPTKEMLKQEKKIKASEKKANGGAVWEILEDTPIMQTGGRKPLEISDPREFKIREQAYNDSLNVYNKYQKLKQTVEQINRFPEPDDHTKTFAVKGNKGKSIIPKTALERLLQHPDSNPLKDFSEFNSGTNESMNPVDIIEYPNDSWYDFRAGQLPVYKKPVQPVVYKPTILNATLPASISTVTPSTTSTYESLEPLRPKQTSIELPQLNTQISQEQPQQQLEFNNIPFQKGSYFTVDREGQQLGGSGFSDRRTQMTDYYDRKTGKKLGAYPKKKFGGNIETESEWEILPEAEDGKKISLEDFKPRNPNSNERIQQQIKSNDALNRLTKGTKENPVNLEEITVAALRNRNPATAQAAATRWKEENPELQGSSANLASALFLAPVTEFLHTPSRVVNQGIRLGQGKGFGDYSSEISETLGLETNPDDAWHSVRNFFVDNAADAIVPMEMLGVGARGAKPFAGINFRKGAKQLPGSGVASSVDDVGRSLTQAPKPAWQMEELPGLHLKSTMEGEAISKIVEPKTGLINTEQALAIIAKESGGADKVAIIRQGLGDNIPKKMDYNDFRKTVQDQLIPLERQFATHSSGYGIDRLGYGKYKTVINERGNPILQPLKGKNLEPIENQTLILGNKYKFGRGSYAHGNPEETLGHAHFLRDTETPDVLTVTQIQSDAFQGTHRNMPKNAPDVSKVEKSLQRMQEIQERNKSVLNKMKTESVDEAGLPVQQYQIKQFEDIVQAQEAANLMKKGELKNFSQKSLLDKSHQERYLQELVDYAGKRGDVNKMRVPTSETAAKVQGYASRKRWNVNLNEGDEVILLDGSTGKVTDDTFDNFIEITKSDGNKVNINYSDTGHGSSKTPPVKSINNVELKEVSGFMPEHQTILKKYSEQPKLIKKLYGVEPKIVTDSKGNTWYEFNIPDKFKKGKGEIKAFQVIGGMGTVGAASQIEQKQSGGKIKLKPKLSDWEIIN